MYQIGPTEDVQDRDVLRASEGRCFAGEPGAVGPVYQRSA